MKFAFYAIKFFKLDCDSYQKLPTSSLPQLWRSLANLIKRHAKRQTLRLLRQACCSISLRSALKTFRFWRSLRREQSYNTVMSNSEFGLKDETERFILGILAFAQLPNTLTFHQ